jgi:hypothetical protein
MIRTLERSLGPGAAISFVRGNFAAWNLNLDEQIRLVLLCMKEPALQD